MCTNFLVVASSVLLVNFRRDGKLSNVVVAAIAARPVLVVVVSTRGFDASSAELLAKVGDGNLKLGEVLKGNEDICMCGSVVGGECTIGCSESCNQGAITGSGCRKVGDGFDRFIFDRRDLLTDRRDWPTGRRHQPFLLRAGLCYGVKGKHGPGKRQAVSVGRVTFLCAWTA